DLVAALRLVRAAAVTLDLRLAGHMSGAASRLRTDRLSGADRRRPGYQPELRGGGADLAGPPLDYVQDDIPAADAAGHRQRVSAGLCREPRRLRRPAGSRRQFRGAVYNDCICCVRLIA